MSEISSDAYGSVSPSIYETARVVALAPWLSGHVTRVLFLLNSQRRDGKWGDPDGYGLVPTLSATEALLTSLRRSQDGTGPGLHHGDMVVAADRGLRALFGWLGNGIRFLVPDTIAAEIVVPALVAQVNAHLDTLVPEPVTGLDTWCGSGRLALPHGMDDELLVRLRHAVRHGQALPAKLLHSLEAIGPAMRGVPFVQPVHGAVGCSPAATAAWLSECTDHP
ncbi:MAG: prenyltransferase, partial [Gammaproteobacteria bacterium]